MPKPIVSGHVDKFGDNINTDDIIPAIYLVTTDEKELAKHCFEGLRRPLAPTKRKPGVIIMAGENFGCGSSREHAPKAIKASGIPCVIAKSFARIFYRNAINIGLPVIECPSIIDETKERDVVEINFEKGTLYNRRTEKEYHFTAHPDLLQKIISAGGLMKYALRRHCEESRKPSGRRGNPKN